MSHTPIEIKIHQSGSAPVTPDDEPTFPRYDGPSVLSFGFRPFFLGAALFAGGAIPVWAWVFRQAIGMGFLYPPREWHVHEMLFGFLPAVMTGFLLTAAPNWTGRQPLRGMPLLALFSLWLAGRLLLARPWPTPLVAAIVDGSFLLAVAFLLWRELACGRAWGQAPIAVLISLYAVSNALFHAMALSGWSTALPERLVLTLVILLLSLIGGRLAPNFTREYLQEHGGASLPVPFSRFDRFAIGVAALTCLTWIVWPDHSYVGIAFVAAGFLHVVRLSRWYGWLTWREPLVLMLHVGYGWVTLSMLLLGGALLGVGLSTANALHAVTTGAVGAMTLAVMTRATLGHTGRARHAGPVTVALYFLATIGALLRVLAPATEVSTTHTHLWLSLSAFCWGGAYLLFALSYGPSLLRPSLDE